MPPKKRLPRSTSCPPPKKAKTTKKTAPSPTQSEPETPSEPDPPSPPTQAEASTSGNAPENTAAKYVAARAVADVNPGTRRTRSTRRQSALNPNTPTSAPQTDKQRKPTAPKPGPQNVDAPRSQPTKPVPPTMPTSVPQNVHQQTSQTPIPVLPIVRQPPPLMPPVLHQYAAKREYDTSWPLWPGAGAGSNVADVYFRMSIGPYSFNFPRRALEVSDLKNNIDVSINAVIKCDDRTNPSEPLYLDVIEACKSESKASWKVLVENSRERGTIDWAALKGWVKPV